MKNSFQQDEPSNTSPLKKIEFFNENFRQTTQTEVTQDSNLQSMLYDSVILESKRVTKLFDAYSNYQQDQMQSFLKMYSQKKKYIRMKKCAKQRRHVYQELVDTEKGYLEDLKIIIDNFITFNNTENILPENEQTYLFCNITQIYGLNVKFYKEIDDVFSKYHPNSCFGQIFQKYIQFFKIYFSYFSDYQQDKIDILCEKYPAFKKKVEDLDETEFRGRGLNGILIKPVQRLPKYALLIKELVKYTWENHPDYESLKKTYQSFLLVTNQIDAQIGKILQNQALFDLQTKFFNNLNINIVESSRKFLINEQVCLLKKGKEQIVNLYMLTDMVVLSKRFQKDQPLIQERLIWYHFIDSNSKFICYKEPTSLIVLLMFENETYTIVCSDLEQKEKIQEQIEIIKSQQLERSNSNKSVLQEEEKVYPIRVFVKDITRGKSRMIFKTYARYELQIKFPGLEFNTWTRHKKLAKLQKLIFQVYNEKQIQLQGRDCQIFSDKIIDGKLNKLHYDERKIVVEQFLETLLNSQLIRYNPQPFLEKLELPSDFFSMIEISQIQRQKTQTLSQ